MIPYCCEPACKATATHHVWYPPFGFEDYTHACLAHLAALSYDGCRVSRLDGDGAVLAVVPR